MERIIQEQSCFYFFLHSLVVDVAEWSRKWAFCESHIWTRLQHFNTTKACEGSRARGAELIYRRVCFGFLPTESFLFPLEDSFNHYPNVTDPIPLISYSFFCFVVLFGFPCWTYRELLMFWEVSGAGAYELIHTPSLGLMSACLALEAPYKLF